MTIPKLCRCCQHPSLPGMAFNGSFVVVSASAGVGRTGVFIALSIALERMRFEGVVDLFQTVKTLRTQRPAMVQTEVGDAADGIKGRALSFLVLVLVFRTSTNCATDLLWNTWEALTTMQPKLTWKGPQGVFRCLLSPVPSAPSFSHEETTEDSGRDWELTSAEALKSWCCAGAATLLSGSHSNRRKTDLRHQVLPRSPTINPDFCLLRRAKNYFSYLNLYL